MPICNHIAPNGEKSNLYSALEQKYGPEKAHDYWTAIRTEQFLMHNDWIDHVTDEMNQYLDHNGEPNIDWIEGKLHIKQESRLFKGQMTFDYESNARPDISAKSTIQAIRMGERTATTRYEKEGHIEYWKDAKIGDVIEFTGKNGEKVNVRITKPLLKIARISAEEWSKKEGWSTNYFDKNVKPKLDQAWQMEYEYINPNGKIENPKKILEPEKEVVSRNLEPENGLLLGKANRNSEEVMKQKVQTIYDEAISNPDKLYNIDYDYKSDKHIYRSGYTAKELANIFDSTGKETPINIRFTPELQRLINNSSKRILEQLPRLPIDIINRDEQAITDQVQMVLLPKMDSEGNLQGYFTAAQQQDITDSALFATHSFLIRDPNFGANAIIKTFKGFQAMAQRDIASNFKYLHDNRVRIAGDMLDQMEALGYSVNNTNRGRILDAVGRLEDLKGIESRGLDESHPEYDTNQTSQDNKEFIEALGHGLSDWGEVSFEHDPKDTASARMKMFIAMQPDMDRGIYTVKKDAEVNLIKPSLDLKKWAQENPREFKSLADQVNRKSFWMQDEKTSNEFKQLLDQNHSILPKKNFLGLNKLIDFESTFQDILETLADSPIHSYDLYKNTLLATGRPNLINLVKSLDVADQQVRNEFSRLVSMQYTNFMMMLFNKTEDADGSSMTLRPILSNRYSQRNTIVKNWRENQKLADIMKVNSVGQRVIDVDRAREKWVPALNALQKIDWSTEQASKGRKYMEDILNISGVHMTEQMMSYLFDNMEKLTKGTSVAGGIARQFSITQDGKPNGMFSAFIMKMAGLSGIEDINSRIDNKADIESRAEMNNPLYTENTTMQILSKVSAMFTPVLHSGTSKSSEGKDIWNYSMHTKLSHQVIDLKENFDNFLKKYEGVDIAKNNLLLNVIAKQPQYRDRIKLMYMDGMKPQWGKRGTTRGDMSDREQLLMSLALFQNQGNGFNAIPTVHYMSLTHSDKKTTPIMMNMPKLDVGNADFTPQEIVGKIGSAFYNVFKSEHNRIVNQKDIDFNDSRYNKGKSLFYYIPEFNKESMQKMAQDGFLTDREFKTLWMNGENLTKQIGSEELKVVNKILNKVVSDRIESTTDTWEKNGITTDTENLFDKKYMNKLLDKNGIERKNNKTDEFGNRVTTFFKNGKELTKQEVNDITIRHAAKEYGLNYFLHNVSMSQLFYGDPAMTFKKGKTDMEAVDSTLKEYGKRLAKDIAPGLDPYFRPEDQFFNSITLADHTQSEDYLSNLKKIFPSYKDVNATDAQEFTTVKEKLIVQYANGTISTKTFNEMMQIVEQNKGQHYEFTNPDHVNVIMQPEKPVYSGQRTPQDGALLEDYIKTSAIPLYPPALSGLGLDGLRIYMENNGIDRAPFESGKKIGSPSNPVSFFSSDGSYKEPDRDVATKATQRLDRSGFRIQQEVPYDETKDSIKTVSQMNKLITEGIDKIEGFKVSGHDSVMNGKEVHALKEQIRKNMILHQFNDFKKEWGIDKDDRIQDKSRIYDKLLNLSGQDKLTINERLSLLSRDSEGNLNIPLQYNTAADSLESMLMSMVKDIAQIKMPGKSFVQATSTGWTFKKESSLDKSKIVWMEHYDGSPLKTTRIDPLTKQVLPAQVLIPFNFNDHNGNPVDVQKYMIEKDGRKILDLTKVPKELTELIGARIPNQGHSSMAAMEVVGFLPKNMGDTIVVPAGFTKQMGADFDVDKLYTYRRPYKYNQDENTFSQDTEGMSKHQTDYFNIHQAVLTHPEMVEKILKPLDKPDLKEENNVLRVSRPESYNYFDHISQLQDFQNGKDAKMLVALTSLAVTFNSVIQDKNLYISEDEMKPDENGKLIRTTIRKFITIKDEHTQKVLKLTNLSGNGTSNYTREDAGPLQPDGIRTKADNQSTIQSAAVDNAKDRALDNLNITPDTYKAADAFMQLETENGEAANLKYATRLLTQPIIRDFASEMRKGNDSLSSTYDPNLFETVVEGLRKGYSGEHDWGELTSRANEIVFDPQLLLKAQSMEEGSFEYVAHQMAALDLFEQLYQIGDRKSQLQSYFNQDTQGAGPNILSALDKADKMNKLEQSPISGADAIYFKPESDSSKYENITEQGFTAYATTGTATRILTQLLPYDRYTSVFAELNAHSGKSAMSIDNQRDVLRAIRSFNYNSGQHWWADAESDRGRLFYTREGENSLARRVEEAKRTWGKDNYFLQRLDPVIGDTTSAPDFLEYQATSVGRIDEQNNNKAWLEMLMSDNKDMRAIGEDLLRYAFLTGGVQDQNSFVKFVPNSYIANTDFGNMLKEKAERIQESDEDHNPTASMPGFIPQFLQHYPERAYNISREVFGDIPASQNYPESFKHDYDNEKQNILKLDDEGNMREFVSYRSNTENKWILYHINPTDSGELYYVRVDTLGNQYTDEYNGEKNGMIRSLFTENRSLAEEIPALSPLASLYESMGNRSHEGSHYERLGIIEGKGRKHMNNILEKIRDNEEVPNTLRSVASFLRGAANIDIPGTKIEIKFDSEMAPAGLTHANGEIHLNPNTESIAQAAETTLHEYIHNRVGDLIYAAGYDRRMDAVLDKFDSLKKKYDARVEAFQKDFPEATEHIRQLDKIRYEAHEALKARLSKEQIADAERKITDHTIGGLSHDETLYYATKTLQEFVPQVMSDKSVQDFVKTIQVPKQENMLQRIWRKITDAIFGTSKQKPTDKLRDALYHTVGLFGEYKQAGNITDALVKGEQIKVPTETSTKGLKSILQSVYRRETRIDKDEDYFTITPLAKYNSIPGPIGKITDRLKKQLDDAYKDISKGDIHQRIQARARYNDLRQDYNDAIRERNLAIISKIADKQLEWVDKVLKTSSSNATEVQAAIDTANIWGEMTEIMYSDALLATPVDPTIAQLQQKATIQRINLINKNAVKVVTDAFGPEVGLTKQDIGENIKEVSTLPAYYLTLARFKPKMVSSIGMLTKTAADNRDEHMQRVHDQLTNLQVKMQKAGITAEHFMQKDTWGLLDRLSNDWHTHLSDLNEKREMALDSIAKSEGLNDSTRRSKQKEVWNSYWNHIKKAGTFVDTRVFFDNETGARKSNVDEHYNKLVDSVGSKDYADELLDKAHQKFQDYIEERKIQRDYLDSQIQLTDEERTGKTPSEQETLRLEHVNSELNRWLEWNSPHRFIEKMADPKETRFVNDGDRWVIMAPKKETGYYDQRYAELEKNEKVKSIFDEYKGLIQEMTSYLPPEHSEKLPPGFFPLISNETISSLSSMIAKLKNWDATLMNQLTATESQEYARIKPDEIPIMYTRETSHTKDEADRSKDLIRVAEVFSHMALHYRYMAPILDQVNVAESIVKEANRQRVSGNQEGSVLRNALDAIKYNKDKLIYNKPNELEGKINNPIYSMKPWEQIKVQRQIKELNEKKTEIENEVLAKIDKGEFDYDEEQEKINKINEQLSEYDKNARYIYGSKVADAMISVNQYKALSYNPFSALANFTFAMISGHTYASGRTDYDGTHYRQGMSIMTHAMKNYYTFGAGMDATARKIRSLMERSQVMSEIGVSEHKVERSPNRLKEAVSPFNWQKSGDYYAKGSMMVAMMLKHEVEAIDKNTGEVKKIRLWDAFDENGKWDTEKYMENSNWYHSDVAQQKDWNKFRDKMRGVATVVFGNQDRNSPLMAKKYALLRLAGQFRMSWFPEGLNARFGTERFDPILGRDVKGRYRSYGTLGLMTSATVMIRSLMDSLPGINIDRFKGLTDKEGNAIKDVDMENMRRNFTGLAWALAMMGTIVMMRALYDDKHKGKKTTAGQMQTQLLINMLIRNQQDLTMYSSPSVWDTVTGNLIPATTVLTDTWKAIKATNHYLFGDTHKDKHASRTWLLKITKATPILNNINKADYMFNRDLDSIQR